MHGKYILTYANGNILEIKYYNDKRHGKGIFTWANGTKYEGEF